MMPFDPHPECRKCGGSMTTWTWYPANSPKEEAPESSGETLVVTCTRCGFAWLMATKEEKA